MLHSNLTRIALLNGLIRRHSYQASVLEVLIFDLCDALRPTRIFKIRIFIDGMRSLYLIVKLIKRLFFLINRLANRFLVFEGASRMTLISHWP